MAITYNHKKIELKPKTYKVGDTFIHIESNYPFLLSSVDEYGVNMISMNTGFRHWNDSRKVEDVRAIKLNELPESFKSDFALCDFILIPKED